MKVRKGFVTNSSSSSFICLRVEESDIDILLQMNNIPVDREELQDWVENNQSKFNDEGELPLKGGISLMLSECDDIDFVGRMIYPSELEDKTVKQLRQELINEMKKEYGATFNENLIFEVGERYY